LEVLVRGCTSGEIRIRSGPGEEIIMKRLIVYLIAVFTLGVAVHAESGLFNKPQTFKQHMLLRHKMMMAMRSGNIEQMEEVCRRAVEIMPQDATWNYNLACALSYRADKSEAFKVLEKAIELGFRNPQAIQQDNDLKQLKGEPQFARLIEKARELEGRPVEGLPVVVPPTVMMGLPVELNASNTVWNMDTGCFQSYFKLLAPVEKGEALAAAYNGPVSDLIKGWLADGSASGNSGDLYVNRDRGHSLLKVNDFPGMTPVVYCKAALEANVDSNLPNTMFSYPVIGNSSMAMTKGFFWRSLPRAGLSDQFASIMNSRLYLDNQMWFYPEHKDYDSELGDLFPANAPFYTVVQGSSFKDKCFMRAFAAAMAALPPATRRYLTSTKSLAPTMQMLLRYSSSAVKKPEDYLTGAAHPVVFDGVDLNLTNLVKMAHDLKPEDVLPVVNLQVVREDQRVSGRDYFDRLPEILFNTPCCISRIVRGVDYERKMVVQAQTAFKGTAEYKWVLLQGDMDKVKIKKLSADGSRVEITVAWHGYYRPENADGSPMRLMSGRVDIGCFIKGRRYYSAPSMVSVYHLPSEERVYNAEKKIVSVDYRNPYKRYFDPALSVQKNWKDLYAYTETGDLKGWFRKMDDRIERFTYAGHKVLQTDKYDRPVLACAVSYLPRQTGGGVALPVMTCVNTEIKFAYKYKNTRDQTGSFAPVN